MSNSQTPEEAGDATVNLMATLERLEGVNGAWAEEASRRAMKSRPAESGRVLGAMGTIYVAGYGPYVKIGWTMGRTATRLRGLQTGAPEPLVVYAELRGRLADERALHQRFAKYRLQGEWFRKVHAVRRWIEEGCPL